MATEREMPDRISTGPAWLLSVRLTFSN
jgi:hypothetical protein